MSDPQRSEPTSKLTDYGFIFGASEVTRIASFQGTVIIGVKAGKSSVEIYVSPTGRSVRVFKNHKEMK